MKFHTKYLWFNTKAEKEIVPIQSEVESAVRESGIKEGFAFVSAMHITSSVFVNDHEPGLWSDILGWLEQVAPARADYAHHKTGETNADAHLKRLVMGHQVMLPITGGKLDLGPWERVFYGEFDGKRRKRVIIKVFGE
ncbi:MAG: secondary thiamine-phosphate synthase enzyme YjbQ [Candidatus Micrarchaeota archaeon]|nr:secondary thiamine-phosphate synthase enzyme YjbQ [Candidatus Micrarchaeota archaeon]